MQLILDGLDAFTESKLSETPRAQRTVLAYILQRTRSHVTEALSAITDGETVPTDIVTVCSELEARGLTFDDSVLDGIGQKDLPNEIAAHLRQVQLNVLINELRGTVHHGDRQLNPQLIRGRNQRLHTALALFLQNESEDGLLDWNKLIDYLPDDLKKLFQTKKIDEHELKRMKEEEAKAQVERLGYEHIITTFREDPKKLSYLLQLFGLTEDEANRIAFFSFRGLRQDAIEPKWSRLMDEHKANIRPDVQIISDYPNSTEDDYIELKLRVPKDATHIYINGSWRRDIKLSGERTLVTNVLLRRGEMNNIAIIAYNEDKKTRTEITTLSIQQESEKQDEDLILEFLKSLKADTLASLEQDVSQKEVFERRLEEFLIKKFAGEFEEGEAYVERLIAQQNSPFITGCLRKILTLFGKISLTRFPSLKPDRELYFFEKYCIYKVRKAMRVGQKGLILANEPGLGKTVTAMSALHGNDLLVVCPNSVASTWKEQEGFFYRKPFLENLAGLPHGKRRAILEETGKPAVVTNVEFVRSNRDAAEFDKGKTDEKFKLLNRRRVTGKPRCAIIDEAHFMRNDSQQTDGVARLETDFNLWLTASPSQDPNSFCRIMRRFLPGDDRFVSPAAFQRAFPKSDPASLRALHILQQKYIVRFLKSDVLPTCDPQIPLNLQKKALPRKEHIDARSESGFGRFMLTEEQQEAILMLFSDWDGFKKKYDKYMPTGKSAREDRIRGSDNQLVKKHALRQIVNNPAFIGADIPSPKHLAMKRVLEKELAEGNKVLVFCNYHDQIDAYSSMLDEMGVKHCRFTGRESKQGYKRGDDGKEEFYEVNEFGNYKIGNDGKPIPAKTRKNAKRISVLDYERLVFQNDPDSRIMLATDAGAVGVTFTAAHTLIEDDLPDRYTQRYQKEDRIHRIDEDRPKYFARYYSMMSQYSPDFLESMRTLELEYEDENGNYTFNAFDEWFKQGTLDEVQYRNLLSQRTIFELINDGIATDADLLDEEEPFHLDHDLIFMSDEI